MSGRGLDFQSNKKNSMIEDSYLQFGAVAVLFAIAIREFFGYLKSKRETYNGGNGGNGAMNNQILSELQRMNNNHLHTIQETLESGNRELVRTIHDDNIKMIEILGEIKGNLSVRK